MAAPTVPPVRAPVSRRGSAARGGRRRVAAALARGGRGPAAPLLASGLFLALGLAARLGQQDQLGTALLVGAALAAGGGIFLRAWRALLRREAGIELLVSLAAAGALAMGEVWEAAAVTFLFLLGDYLEARTMARTRRALADLLELAPATATVLRGGAARQVPVAEVATGETVIVRPGDRIPVDGRVVRGGAAVDESAITGEAVPVEKTLESAVYAGTISHGLLQVRATEVGADTTLARIVRRVEEAQEAKAPAQRLVERFARWYTPAMVLAAALVWLLTRDLPLALTLLVISCPGALVVSTPVAVVAGIGRAARRGILIKGGEHLERVGRVSALALDKTGTLTRGEPVLTDIVTALSGWSPGPLSNPLAGAQGEALRLAAGAEAASSHPLGRAILQAAAGRGPLGGPGEVESGPGGIRARVEGRPVVLGSVAYLEGLGIGLPGEAALALEALRAAGKTVVALAVDGAPAALLGIRDEPRDGAERLRQELAAQGVSRVVMLTGDHRRAAESIAMAAGVAEFYADLLPEDKEEHIRALQREGLVVAMAGDGINDAPALAAADIGIAMGRRGTDVAIETADLALLTDDLLKIPEAIRLAKRTLRTVRQNLAVALVTVAALLAGVLFGEVHMAGGMLVHQLSVLLVIGNAMRLLRA